MRKIVVATFFTVTCSTVYAVPPDENLIKSCLFARATAPSVNILSLNANKVSQQDEYADGFNAIYIIRYRGADVGYAENKTDQALIYLNKIYLLSEAKSLGKNHNIKPSAFDPTLAQWSIAKERRRKFLCVSFNFNGLGQSGSFQNVYGGYLLSTKTKEIYFVVRDVKQH